MTSKKTARTKKAHKGRSRQGSPKNVNTMYNLLAGVFLIIAAILIIAVIVLIISYL